MMVTGAVAEAVADTEDVSVLGGVPDGVKLALLVALLVHDAHAYGVACGGSTTPRNTAPVGGDATNTALVSVTVLYE